VLEPASGGPMGRMVLTGLCRVAEMSLASSVIGNAPASTPRRRRAFTRVILSLSPSAHCLPAQGRDAPTFKLPVLLSPEVPPPHL
jgi:hypothetical protein